MLGREIKVVKRKGGRGDITYYINIPKHIQYVMGNPEKYRIRILTDRLIVHPVRNIEISEEPEEDIEEIQREMENMITDENIRKTNKPCVKVIDYLDQQAYIHEGIIEITVFCIHNKYQHKALIKYGDGTIEIIENGLSCGYGGTSPGALVELISYLSQRTRTDPQIEQVEKTIKNTKIRRGAIKIETNTFENKIIIKPLAPQPV